MSKKYSLETAGCWYQRVLEYPFKRFLIRFHWNILSARQILLELFASKNYRQHFLSMTSCLCSLWERILCANGTGTLKNNSWKVSITGTRLNGDSFFVGELKHWEFNNPLLSCSESFIMLLYPGELGLVSCELYQWCWHIRKPWWEF